MTPLRERFIEDMELRQLAERTRYAYTSRVVEFAEFFRRSPADLGSEHVRRFLLYLVREKKVSRSYFKQARAALSFLYRYTLGRAEVLPSVPSPRDTSRRIPEVLSPEEVVQFLQAVGNLKHRTMLTTIYATGVRVQELVHLQVRDVNRARSHIRVRNGKGGRDRLTLLPEPLLTMLEEYWRVVRPIPRGQTVPPETWLFPSSAERGQPLSRKTVLRVCLQTTRSLGRFKRVTPHILRHSFASHLLEQGNSLPAIQALLGHTSLRSTETYLHISNYHLQQIVSPLEKVLQITRRQTRA
jgi:site-specific recombinase XerD